MKIIFISLMMLAFLNGIVQNARFFKHGKDEFKIERSSHTPKHSHTDTGFKPNAKSNFKYYFVWISSK